MSEDLNNLDPHADLFRSIDFELDDSSDDLLSSPVTYSDSEEEQSLPRELIAAEVRSTRVIAKLERPLRLGTSNNLPAFLLCFQFSFQRVSQGFFDRIRAVQIEIVFEDAPQDALIAKGRNPSIVRFHPDLYEGPVSKGTNNYHWELNAQLAAIAGGPSIGAAVSQDVTNPRESKLIVHGVKEGRPSQNKIVWTIDEDHSLATGMPREFKLPLIVNLKESRRFSAKLVVAAEYGFKRGRLAKNFPVIGRNVQPLFFDPQLLQDIAKENTRTGQDGKPIAELVGNLDQILLNTTEYSSFTNPTK